MSNYNNLRIKTTEGKHQPTVFTAKIADIPGGVTVCTGELGGGVVYEGTPVGKDENGLYHIIKSVIVAEDTDSGASTLTVLKGHNLQVGDTLSDGGAVSAIATNADNDGYDDLTLGSSLSNSYTAGDGISVCGEDGSLPYEIIGVLGDSQEFEVGGNNNLTCNVWLIAVLKKANLQIGLDDAMIEGLPSRIVLI